MLRRRVACSAVHSGWLTPLAAPVGHTHVVHLSVLAETDRGAGSLCRGVYQPSPTAEECCSSAADHRLERGTRRQARTTTPGRRSALFLFGVAGLKGQLPYAHDNEFTTVPPPN